MCVYSIIKNVDLASATSALLLPSMCMFNVHILTKYYYRIIVKFISIGSIHVGPITAMLAHADMEYTHDIFLTVVDIYICHVSYTKCVQK